MNVDNKKLADDLRALADKIETTNAELKVEVSAHRVGTLETLRAVSNLMQKPVADHSRGTHWVKGNFADGIEVTAYYSAGILGKTKKTKVVQRVVEVTTDISPLLAGR